MGFDRFLNIMHIGNDDEYDDEEYDDDFDTSSEEDFDDDEPRKKSFFSGRKKAARSVENSLDEEETPRQRPASERASSRTYEDNEYSSTRTSGRNSYSKSGSGNSKIVQMRASSKSVEVHIFKPASFDDVEKITEYLLAGRAVIVNFELLSDDMLQAQRIVDYLCGACAAIDGNYSQVASLILVVSPNNVSIANEFDIDEVANMTGMMSIKL